MSAIILVRHQSLNFIKNHTFSIFIWFTENIFCSLSNKISWDVSKLSFYVKCSCCADINATPLLRSTFSFCVFQPLHFFSLGSFKVQGWCSRNYNMVKGNYMCVHRRKANTCWPRWSPSAPFRWVFLQRTDSDPWSGLSERAPNCV